MFTHRQLLIDTERSGDEAEVEVLRSYQCPEMNWIPHLSTVRLLRGMLLPD